MSTSTEYPTATIVRGFYDALKQGDIEAFTRLMSPDITMLMPGRSPLAGIYTGRDAIVGFLGEMMAATGGTYRATLSELYANDTQAVAVHHATGTRGDRTLDAHAALVFEVSDGAVTALTVHQSRQDEWDEFFDV